MTCDDRVINESSSAAACLACAIVRYFQVDDEDGMMEALAAHSEVFPSQKVWMRPDVWEKYKNAEHVCCEEVDR